MNNLYRTVLLFVQYTHVRSFSVVSIAQIHSLLLVVHWNQCNASLSDNWNWFQQLKYILHRVKKRSCATCAWITNPFYLVEHFDVVVSLRSFCASMRVRVPVLRVIINSSSSSLVDKMFTPFYIAGNNNFRHSDFCFSFRLVAPDVELHVHLVLVTFSLYLLKCGWFSSEGDVPEIVPNANNPFAEDLISAGTDGAGSAPAPSPFAGTKHPFQYDALQLPSLSYELVPFV